ncbi:MAG: glycosyl transferase family 1 [Parvibaculum sp.]|nr:glycosyl transferase family 1 [Parvibaculum sp.]
MRVMQLIKTTRGATWALRQVRVLRDLGVEVHVVLPDGEGLTSEYRNAGAAVHILDTDIASLKRPAAFLEARRAFRSLVDSTKPQLLHSHFVGTTLFMRFAMGNSGPKRIFQVPGPLHLENLITKQVEIRSAGALDFWVASCSATREIYRNAGISDRKIGMVYYGIDFDRFRTVSPVDLRSSLGISRDAAVVGMVAYIYGPKKWLGQRRGLKGHEDLIDALGLLKRHGRDIAGVFVGGAWTGAERYAEQVYRYGKTVLADSAHFLGNRDDVADLYAGFDVAVHPSHSENLGGAVESLALGVPTITTNVGGFPDVVLPGKTGWLVPPRQPYKLVTAIEDALDRPELAREYATQGSLLVREKLDVNKNGRELLSYYQSIA